jgi:hypothetical protein
MRNPLRRLDQDPPNLREMALAMRRDAASGDTATDDYLIVGEEEDERPSAGTRIVHGLQFVLILVLAALSLAVFWLIGMMLNIL